MIFIFFVSLTGWKRDSDYLVLFVEKKIKQIWFWEGRHKFCFELVAAQ